MEPITPIIPGNDVPVVEFGVGQAQYKPLPAVRLEDANGTIVTRWHLSWLERLQVLLGGSIWLTMLTFHKPVTPVMLHAECPYGPAEGAER